jgi:hypothetical protein
MRNEIKKYACFAICAAYLPVGYMFTIWHSFPIIRKETDGIGYMYRSLAFPPKIDAFHGPGYSLFVSLADTFLGNTFLSAKVCTFIFSAVLLISCAYLYRSVSSNKTSVLALLVTILSPIFLLNSNLIMSDITGASLFIASLAVICNSKNSKYLFIGGLLMGLAYLTRYVYIYIFISSVPLIYFYAKGNKKLKSKKLAVFVLGFLVSSLPWMVYLYQSKGDFLWNKNYLNIAFAAIRDGGGWNQFPYNDPYGGLISVLLEHWMSIAKNGLKNLARLPTYVATQHEVAGVFAGVGFFTWARSLKRKQAVIVTLSIVYAAIVSVLWLTPRFLLPLLPIISLSIAGGIMAVPQSLNLKPLRLYQWLPSAFPVRMVVAVICLVVLGATSVRQSIHRYSVQLEDYEQASKMLSKRAFDGATALAPKPHIPFFAGIEHISFRGDHSLVGSDTSTLCSKMSKIKPDFLVYDTRYGVVEFPGLEGIISGDISLGCLKLSFEVSVDGEKVRVFKYKTK